MFFVKSRAMDAYRSVGVETVVATATPHQLILMLFEGARIAVAAARVHMQLGETAAKGEAIGKAVSIIANGLKVSLDIERGGELALNLRTLYDYMVSQITAANLKNDPAPLDEVGRLLAELEQAWRQIGQDNAEQPPTQEPRPQAHFAA